MKHLHKLTFPSGGDAILLVEEFPDKTHILFSCEVLDADDDTLKLQEWTASILDKYDGDGKPLFFAFSNRETAQRLGMPPMFVVFDEPNPK